MSIAQMKQDIEDLKKQRIDAEIEEAKNRKKFKLFKFPSSVKRKAKKSVKEGKFLVVYLKNNKTIDFFWAESTMGLIDVDPNYKQVRVKPYHGFEPEAVYSYKNKFGALVIPEWRLLPVGGVVEDLEREVSFGGTDDILTAKALNISSMAEITLANMMEKKELDANAKKKGNMGWLLWVGVALIGGYVLLKVLGVF
ncbi:MAG TPA: hypothetical protein PLT65_04380 [Bacilli bacterium]|nr:hypothetical protein [Bacilli bacterium]